MGIHKGHPDTSFYFILYFILYPFDQFPVKCMAEIRSALHTGFQRFSFGRDRVVQVFFDN